MYIFDYIVFIGRFQPFHLAHMQTVEIALQQSQHVILVLGSAQLERNIKNPFLAKEREMMILSNFTPEQRQRIHFVHMVDVYDDQKWVSQITKLVKQQTQGAKNIGLIGHFKDDSSYYLKLFPEWQLIELESLKESLSATPVREAYYRGEIKNESFPSGTLAFLNRFQKTDTYQQLRQKYLNADATNLLKI